MKNEHKPVNNKKNQKSPVLDKKKQSPRLSPHTVSSDNINPLPARLNVERLVKWTSLLVNVAQSIAWLGEYINSNNLQLWIAGNQWFLVLPVTGILLPVASLFLPSGAAQAGSQAKGKAGELGSRPIIVD